MRRLLVNLSLLALTIGGCAPHSAVSQQGTGVRPVALRTAPPSLDSIADPMQNALARVRAHPLYKQAKQACREKHFGAAAGLLARLEALPDLTPDQVRLVRDQRVVCLQDAHLPMPPALCAASLPPSTPSSAVSPPRSPVAVSPLQADCGPRALLFVCQHLSVSASLPQLRQRAGTTSQGTSMAGLAAAKAVGLKTQGVQVSREALPEQDMPAIAWVNNHHFIAVLSLQGSGESGTAVIHDPNSDREETIPQERLLRLCNGYLLLVRR